MLQRFAELIGSVWGWLLLLACQFFAIDGVRLGLLFLLLFFIIDYVTGLGAAWRERGQNNASAPFFFESRKMRMSLLKACTYLMFILMSWMMWLLFFDGTVQLPVSTKEVNIIGITIGICIAIECWSILENCKRMGFDIIGGIATAFKGFWKSYKTITRG